MANGAPKSKRRMEKDIELINKVKKEKDNSSLKQLIDKHSGIYVEMVNRYIPNSMEGIIKDDILEEKNYCIYDAIIKFDENKNTKFSTYLGNLAKWRCLNIYNKKIKFPQESFESIKSKNLSCDSDIEKIEEVENVEKIYKIVNKSKDSRVKKIFKMRYANKNKLTPWKKIAKKLDLSIQGCINIHNNYLKEIKKYVQ